MLELIARLAVGVAAITVTVSIAGRVLVGSSGTGVAQPVDDAIRTWVLADLHAWTGAAHLLAVVGSTLIILVASAIVSALILASTGDRARALIPITAVLVADLVGALTKVFVGRARPTGDEIGLLELYSFPSGHTVAAVAFATGLLFAWSPGRRHRLLGVSAVAVVAVVVAVGRLVVDAHWATDVLAGIIVGVASAVVARLALAPWASEPRHADTPVPATDLADLHLAVGRPGPPSRPETVPVPTALDSDRGRPGPTLSILDQRMYPEP